MTLTTTELVHEFKVTLGTGAALLRRRRRRLGLDGLALSRL